jgi:aerobic-type carbon monoxide dehydrogenase small subunit (CoxS/CutS family)
MASKAFLDNHPSPDEQGLKEALSGHYCRCISHYQVVEAVMRVAESKQAES